MKTQHAKSSLKIHCMYPMGKSLIPLRERERKSQLERKTDMVTDRVYKK